MKIKDFETLSRLIGGDVRKQRSVLKGQLHRLTRAHSPLSCAMDK